MPLIEDFRARVDEIRTNVNTRIDEWKERIDEWKERGWRPEGERRLLRGSRGSRRQRLQIVEEIREKGLISALKARREKRGLQRGRGKEAEQTPQSPEEIAIEKEVVPYVDTDVALTL